MVTSPREYLFESGPGATRSGGPISLSSLAAVMPMSGDDDPAHVARGGLEKVGRLQRLEGDGEVEIGNGRQDAPVVGGGAARQVDRDPHPGLSGKVEQALRYRVLERPAEPGAEQCVDQKRRRLRPSQSLDGRVPGVGGAPGRLAPRIGQRGNSDLNAARAQLPRDDIAVAAIVAGAAQDQSRQRPGIAPDRLGRGLAGALHQCFDRRAGRDRRLLGGAHLRRGENDAAAHRARTLAGRRK